MFPINCFRIIIGAMFIQLVSAGWHKYILVKSPNVRYADVIKHYISVSKLQCLASCDETDECSSVNHNSDTDKCELTEHVPRVLAPESTDEDSWRVYYRDRYIPGVNAWQDSARYNSAWGLLYAKLAIDGNRENNDDDKQLACRYCASTKAGYTYWATELESVASVSYVIIYFRNRNDLNKRNTGLRLLISATRQDSDNNVGSDCAFYAGPPDKPDVPVKVTCTQPVTGKFMKIIQNNKHSLTLCEVEVYSV